MARLAEGKGPTPLIWYTAYFASVGVSWLVIVGQSMLLKTTNSNS